MSNGLCGRAARVITPEYSQFLVDCGDCSISFNRTHWLTYFKICHEAEVKKCRKQLTISPVNLLMILNDHCEAQLSAGFDADSLFGK